MRAAHSPFQEEYAAMRDMYMRSGQGFVLVYDVTNKASFNEVPIFCNQILSAKDADRVPLVIVGNKCDIEDGREVSTAEGIALAKSLGADFFEGSAKFRKNVDEAFFAAVCTRGISIHVPDDVQSLLMPMLQVRLIRTERRQKQAARSSDPAADPDVSKKKKKFCSIL
jgi:hypothetical protein